MATLPAWADQLWAGQGRVVRGAGKGASVPELQLETEDRAEGTWVFFINGPDAGEVVQLSEDDSVETMSGVWQFLAIEPEALEVKLYQDAPYRVIHYQLEPTDLDSLEQQ